MKTLQKNLIYNMVYQILTIILPLITAPYISRTLGAESLGIYSYTSSVAAYFLLLAMLGISNYGNRSVAETKNNRTLLNSTFSSIFLLQVITHIIVLVAYISYTILNINENYIIVRLQTIYVFSGLFDISWLFFGLEKFKLTVTRSLILRILTVILIFIFVHEPSDLWKYTLIMNLGTLVSQMWLCVLANKYVTLIWPGWRSIFSNLKSILILFVPVLAYSIYKVMDKIMLGQMTSYRQVGLYNSAEKIISIPTSIITAVGTVMLPRMSSIIAKSDYGKAKNYICLSMKMITIVATAMSFGLMGVGKVLAPTFFGEEFSPCGQIIYFLAISVLFMAWANVIRTQYLIPRHKDKIYVFSTIVGAVINFCSNLLLIPRYQALGAAVGTVAAECSVMVIQWIGVYKELPVYKYLLSYIPVLGIGCIMMIFVSIIGEKMGTGIDTLIVQIGVGGVFFLGCVYIYLIIIKDEVWKIIEQLRMSIRKVVCNENYK